MRDDLSVRWQCKFLISTVAWVPYQMSAVHCLLSTTVLCSLALVGDDGNYPEI
jgi:hypothetical protein